MHLMRLSSGRREEPLDESLIGVARLGSQNQFAYDDPLARGHPKVAARASARLAGHAHLNGDDVGST
jgi:hypothetical protein